MNQTVYTLVSTRALTRDVFELTLSGDTSAITRPGQFVDLALDGLFLRRPISVCDWECGRLVLILRTVGEGTRALASAEPGARFDTLSGLGNGYDAATASGKTPVLIGGGVGVPPLYGLARRMAASGPAPAVALGFNTGGDVFYADEFRALGCEVLLSTVDGSAGDKGFVTDLVRKTDCDYAFCCGPEPMLKAVYALPQISDGQFSFEARMGCGFGACMGCSCKTKYGAKRICKDGPVLKKEEIVW